MSKCTILIVGAGTWGCSIALELARRGHANIKVLDANPLPSPTSAGNDLNKIVEEPSQSPNENDDDASFFWNTIQSLSLQKWKEDPVFSSFYHETGLVMAAATNRGYQACLDYAAGESSSLTPLDTAQAFHQTMPQGVLQGSFPDWRGYWRKTGAGWAFASGPLKAIHDESIRLGVQFICGNPEGRVTNLIYSFDDKKILGAQTADGASHLADRTVLSAGAYSDQILDFESQLRPTAWTLAHLPLTVDEAKSYRNLPVLYCVDRGFFIEPDERGHEIKICDEHPGYLNPVIDTTTGNFESIPFARRQIPKEAEQRMRLLLEETMPQFADRDFSFARICWDADTVDRIFLIDKHPCLENLVVAVGGSGNGFMTSPVIGTLAAEIIESRGDVPQRVMKKMAWRPSIAHDRKWWDTQGRHVAEEKVMDLREVREWSTIGDNQ